MPFEGWKTAKKSCISLRNLDFDGIDGGDERRRVRETATSSRLSGQISASHTVGGPVGRAMSGERGRPKLEADGPFVSEWAGDSGAQNRVLKGETHYAQRCEGSPERVSRAADVPPIGSRLDAREPVCAGRGTRQVPRRYQGGYHRPLDRYQRAAGRYQAGTRGHSILGPRVIPGQR